MPKKKTNEPVKIVFDPGCFDNFDGTQEELDELVASIHQMFEGKTQEEMKAMSHPVDWDELAEQEPELFEQLNNIFEQEPRKLN